MNPQIQQAYREDLSYFLHLTQQEERRRELYLRRVDAEVWMKQEQPSIPRVEEVKKKRITIGNFIKSLIV